jgi:nuclear RNA export factor
MEWLAFVNHRIPRSVSYTASGYAFSPIFNRPPQFASRIAPLLDPLAIRGAAGRNPITPHRSRRNAISLNGSGSGPSKGPSTSAVDVLREFVKRRYNPETRFLNLEDMEHDQFLIDNKIPTPSSTTSASREVSAIFKLASQLDPVPLTISLANNKLRNGHCLVSLHRYLPKLANLSLANNNLREYKDLDYISAKRGKLLHLRELLLLGNPVRENHVKNSTVERYRHDIARICSGLEMLDSEAIPKIAFDNQPAASTSAVAIPDHALPTTFPMPMGPAFLTGVDPALVSQFLSRFFQCFDNQRPALRAAYDANATFSFNLNTNVPDRARLLGFYHKLPNQKGLQAHTWLNANPRNLARVSDNHKGLQVGPDNILSAIDRLPLTRHDVGGPPEKFTLDAFPVAVGQAMGLLLTVHGEFVELPVGGIRSFDRSFVLAPASEGTQAKADGWDVIILSDQLTVRGYSSHESWRPGRLTVQAGEFVLPEDQQRDLDTISEPQKSMVVNVCKRTKLNVKFAYDCLAGNEWDVTRAVANFNEVKGTLPSDAYLPA